jgi:hypothetical protein
MELLRVEKDVPANDLSPERQGVAAAVQMIAGLKPASPQSTAWVLSQKPDFATMFSMARCLRNLMVYGSQIAQTWTCLEMVQSDLFVPGLGGQILKFKYCLQDATSYEPAAPDTVATLELRSRVNEEHALEETVTQLREEAALHRKALSAALADSSMRAPRQQRSPLASWLKSPWQKGALLFRAALPRSHRISAPRSRFDCTW